MTCADIQADLSLYLYGELDFAAEEQIETHLDYCAFCQLALNREKEWHAMVNRQQQDVRPEWLSACRSDLLGHVADEPTTAAHARHKIAGWLHSLLDVRLTERSFRLAAVSSLLLIGFGAGRLWNSLPLTNGGRSMLDSAGVMSPSVTQVREIRPENDNRVRIILQQTQMREVTASRDDEAIRSLLVNAAKASLDPGVRMDSVEMLAGQPGLEIRDALVNTVRNDANPAVRVKAIESLRRFPSDAVIREALESALAHDEDAGVRAEAMDVLIPAEGNLQVTPQLIETISNVMRAAPSDEYVRVRCAQILNGRVLAHDTY